MPMQFRIRAAYTALVAANPASQPISAPVRQEEPRPRQVSNDCTRVVGTLICPPSPSTMRESALIVSTRPSTVGPVIVRSRTRLPGETVAD
jgi:hypothetical protein